MEGNGKEISAGDREIKGNDETQTAATANNDDDAARANCVGSLEISARRRFYSIPRLGG